MNNRFKKVKSLVANGEIRLAAYELFSLLGTFTPSDKEAYDDVVMLISTYLENEHQNILGVSNDQSHMERAKKGILTVLRNLEATWNDSEERVEDIDNSINTHVEKGDFKMASKKFKELLSKAENLFVEFENLISHIDSSNASSFTSILDKLEEEISKYLSITALPFMNYSIKRDKDKLNTIINRKFKNKFSYY